MAGFDPIVRTDYLTPMTRIGATIGRGVEELTEGASDVYNAMAVMRDKNKTIDVLEQEFVNDYGDKESGGQKIEQVRKYFKKNKERLTSQQLVDAVYKYRDDLEGWTNSKTLWEKEHPDESYPMQLSPKIGRGKNYGERLRGNYKAHSEATKTVEKRKGLDHALKFFGKHADKSYDALSKAISEEEAAEGMNFMQFPEIKEKMAQKLAAEKETRLAGRSEKGRDIQPLDKWKSRNKLLTDRKKQLREIPTRMPPGPSRTAVEDQIKKELKLLTSNPKIFDEDTLEDALGEAPTEDTAPGGSAFERFQKFKGSRAQ